MNLYRIRLAKESFKFSSTHFTIFSANEAERLHGHNYQITVECDLADIGPLSMGFEFNTLKHIIKSLTELWDERVLLPKRSSFLRLSEETVRTMPHWVIEFGSRSYRIPKDDIVLLDTENVTSEELARLFTRDLAHEWKIKLGPSEAPKLSQIVRQLRVTVEETRGQSATFFVDRPLDSTRSTPI